MGLSNSIASSMVGSISATIAGDAPVVLSPIASVAQANATTGSIAITLPSVSNALIEAFITSGVNSNGEDDYDVSIGGVDVPFNTGTDAALGNPELLHYYTDSTAFRALSGAQTVTVTGSLSSIPELFVRVLSNVGSVVGTQKYEANESTSLVPFTGVNVLEGDYISVCARHQFDQSWDTFVGVSESYTGQRISNAGAAISADATNQTYSIDADGGSTNARKAGLLIQYRKA